VNDQVKDQMVDQILSDEPAAYDGPEFVLVLRENREQQTIELAGLAKPELKPGDPLVHPSHVVGAFIAENFDWLLRQVEGWYAAQQPEGDTDATPPAETIPMIEAKAALLEQIEKEAP
jgi:hypothetical protein